jgi:predicted secreted protein
MERDEFQAAVLEMLKDKCEDQKAMRKTGDRIIQLLEEQNRLLTIFVQPVISLQSQQLARMTSEERKKESRATVARLKAKYGGKSKRV